jgi:hypothetical protein
MKYLLICEGAIIQSPETYCRRTKRICDTKFWHTLHVVSQLRNLSLNFPRLQCNLCSIMPLEAAVVWSDRLAARSPASVRYISCNDDILQSNCETVCA